METILAISPGTRLVGIAIFEDGELRDWKIHAFYQKWSNKKLRQILKLIDIYIAEHRITEIVVKIPDRVTESKGFDLVLGGINVLSENIGRKAMFYCLADIKRAFSKEVAVNKKELERLILVKFPELALAYKGSSKGSDVYYTKAFEAVGAGYCYCMRPKRPIEA